MLVKKTEFNKKTKIILVVVAVFIVAAGYFVYKSYFAAAKPKAVNSSLSTAILSDRKIVPAIEDSIFSDTQFLSLERKKFAGFTEQYEGMALDEKVPLAPVNISVNNLRIGGKLLISWQLPEQVNFNKIKIFRSEKAGTLGKSVALMPVDPAKTRMSLEDADLTNGTVYFYTVKSAIYDPNIPDDKQDGLSSLNIQQYSAIPNDEFPPTAPSNVKISDIGNDQLMISWVEPPENDASGIRIYESKIKGQVGQLMEKLTPGVEAHVLKESVEALDCVTDTAILEKISVDKKTGRSCAMVAIDPNITYYYTITSVDNSGNESSKDILASPYNYNPFEPIEF
ncbi:MAG: fibronectin type III domain-containing protein [Patescibacteria group bacterium]|jgi:hypothetical protein